MAGGGEAMSRRWKVALGIAAMVTAIGWLIPERYVAAGCVGILAEATK
jgi:hypothetical protein